ncbi:cytochrome d ubiquinol oxidase subunit II [Rudaeicoccus suwonensis]|uniref:Cytochrome bd-I ubiquinol oxidase subunit 2 apoprotein n=1 Tax=Rudaeicoccus suwonensis TaxID=657409 RepID=A0A561E6M1_9MICO|nr:cytochrome d ubiquinol oxidase subunit II [Rudaeicoccus suwonensis]TWE11268.1 cytochrome bd-I ubiquinol oxidase subunit 2 apoprotein [Rudaeicoccus suwonensis]
MTLETFWFIVIGVLWTGYLVLEGFDFGVGMLLAVIGRGEDAAETNTRRRLMLTTIGPFWDGNEVWLLTAGGATFAAFPAWYATMFSGFYLALLLVLVSLILRNMGLEYRYKRDSEAWRRGWDLIIMVCSFLPPLLVGVALTNLVHGVPINAAGNFTGNLFTLLNPMSLLGGLTLVAVSLTHGAFYLALKTDGPVREKAASFGDVSGPVAAVLAVVLLVWVNIHTGDAASWIASAIGAIALVVAILANRVRRDGIAFLGTFLAIAGTVATYFLAVFPNVMPSTTDAAYSLTVHNAASSHLTLQIMTGAALVFTPIMLIYTAWTYWVFRKRLTMHVIAPQTDPLAPIDVPAHPAGADEATV